LAMDICGTYVFCQRFVRISFTNPKKKVAEGESCAGLHSHAPHDNGITLSSILFRHWVPMGPRFVNYPLGSPKLKLDERIGLLLAPAGAPVSERLVVVEIRRRWSLVSDIEAKRSSPSRDLTASHKRRQLQTVFRKRASLRRACRSPSRPPLDPLPEILQVGRKSPMYLLCLAKMPSRRKRGMVWDVGNSFQ
jgi:hypothetical protein